jgi:hypothetical protein
MAKRATTKQPESYSWAVYQIARKQLLLGYVHDQPDEKSAIEGAIREFGIPEALRGRLTAERRD